MSEKALDNNKVILGLSGGVDSTVATLILKKKGFEVTGLYFDISGENKAGQEKAKKVASELDIDLIIKDVSKEFKENIIQNFINEYENGRTPNPCVLCNPTIKFPTLLKEADSLGAKYIATGHYAKVEYSTVQGCHAIKVADNQKKDQSYMLYRLPEEITSRLIFPLSEVKDKSLTRDFARKNEMSNADDKDSQEICFIKEKDYIEFLEKQDIRYQKGNFVDKNGNVLGTHDGLIRYTIGQRKGLGITFGKPVYVTNIIPQKNEVILGDNEDLFKKEIICKEAFFVSTSGQTIPKCVTGKKLLGKIRYKAEPSECTVEEFGDNIKVKFKEPQRAATNGQSLVLYLDNEVIGGGIIDMSQSEGK